MGIRGRDPLTGRARAFAVTFALAFAVALIWAGGARAAANGQQDPPQPAKLTLKGGEPTLNLEEDRDARTVVLLLDSSKALSNPPVVTLGDGRTKEGWPFDAVVTASADVAGNATVRVPVVVDPSADAREGDYRVDVRLSGPDVQTADTAVTVLLDRSPGEGCAWVLAGCALLLGVGAGSVLRLAADQGMKLRELLGRYEALAAALRGVEGPLPAALSRKLAALQLLLARGDAARAEATLAELEQKTPAVLEALDALAPARGEVERQKQRVAMMQPPAEQPGLREVVAREEERLNQVPDAAWDDPKVGKPEAAALARQIAGFSAFLEAYEDPNSRDDLREALRLYREGDFERAANAWRGEKPQLAGTQEGDRPADEVPRQPRFAGFTWWLARHAPLIVGVITGLALVLVGLLTVFDVDEMFLEDDLEDFLVLVLWGFGSALTGVVLSDLAGKAVGIRPAAA